ncbi:MAG: hypothetical protein WC783_00030 [Candidatus Paceibacterota bacterium]|jgi:hypothetical protein
MKKITFKNFESDTRLIVKKVKENESVFPCEVSFIIKDHKDLTSVILDKNEVKNLVEFLKSALNEKR